MKDDTLLAPDDETIVIEDAGDSGTPGATGTASVATTGNVATEDELVRVKQQLKQEEDGRRAAEERAAQASRRAEEVSATTRQLADGKFYAEKVAVANALAAAQNEAESLKREQARQLAENDFNGVAESNYRMSQVAQRIAHAEQQQSYIERAEADFTARQEQAQRQQEQQRAQPKISQAVRDWISAHPRFNTDAAYRQAAIGADSLARLREIKPDTDEYFAFIEEQLGERTAAPSQQQAAQRGSSSAAPPSRSVGNPGGSRSTVLRLTPQEREMADITMSRIKDPAERYKTYALNKQKMLADNPLVHTG